ncbi:DUF4350 domain-containing protein [candidate division KSB1 bacterium]|nr:DUF4350 domain-containing protein [candidate division KSB1 bacterium]NIR69584.1 DUF4350 domain-containing protein [candidate division KSB1 bacterium]NIS25932.1 DUF4350 domain-containing protein [candidate division KSB1 bacterium]NIT72813.1 DUF4350 domain-containing protein [candidate division KSB1 bacterium]NIU26620.1 DUF4350 domain-containing protein [candidate division KSB1 bacterium]
MRAIILTCLLFLVPGVTGLDLKAQQVADVKFNPDIRSPVYKKGEGPVVFIDEAHNNFHTLDGRYKPFADLLQKDGYQVKAFTKKFTKDRLNKSKILVISNALHDKNVGRWILPNPSAFTQDEIAAVTEWVEEGGSLFLIADHMPFPGAAADLAAAFGFEFNNGFAFDTSRPPVDIFSRQAGTLRVNEITNGRNQTEGVDSVATFIGQAFKVPETANLLLTLNLNFVSLMPDTAWVFNDDTRRVRVGGWAQGAYSEFGDGRVVVFGEAAMFSAQVSGENKSPMGMNHPAAVDNRKLLLNIIHWLDGVLG